MRNTFVLTDNSNVIILKIIKSSLIVIILSLCFLYLNHFSKDFIYILLSFGFITFTSLLILKGHKVIGKISFETSSIIIERYNQTIQLPFQKISGIKFILHGRKRRSYMPITYAPIGMNMADGTGNIVEIETEEATCKLDLFLLDSWDEKSLEFQIKRLADSGIKIDKRKLPAILGDSI